MGTSLKRQDDEEIEKLVTLDQLTTEAPSPLLNWEAKYSFALGSVLIIASVGLLLWEVLQSPSQILTIKSLPGAVGTLVGATFFKIHNSTHDRLERIRKERAAKLAILLIRDDAARDKALSEYAAGLKETSSLWKRIVGG